MRPLSAGRIKSASVSAPVRDCLKIATVLVRVCTLTRVGSSAPEPASVVVVSTAMPYGMLPTPVVFADWTPVAAPAPVVGGVVAKV